MLTEHNYVSCICFNQPVVLNPLTAEWALWALMDFTLSNARRFYSSMGNPLDGKGLKFLLSKVNNYRLVNWLLTLAQSWVHCGLNGNAKRNFPLLTNCGKDILQVLAKEFPPSPSSSSFLAPPPPPSYQSAQPPQIFNSVPCLTGRDRTNYLLVKEAKIIAMTCTHAALKRRDLVELGFKVKKLVWFVFNLQTSLYSQESVPFVFP